MRIDKILGFGALMIAPALGNAQASAQFNLDQLQVGKQAFMDMLTKSLEADTTDVAAE